MDHYGDAVQRRLSSPIVSDGGTDELGKNRGHNDSNRHKERVQELGGRGSWESMLVCLFTTVWQKFHCALLTVCTIPISTRTQLSTGRRQIERVVR